MQEAAEPATGIELGGPDGATCTPDLAHAASVSRQTVATRSDGVPGTAAALPASAGATRTMGSVA